MYDLGQRRKRIIQATKKTLVLSTDRHGDGSRLCKRDFVLACRDQIKGFCSLFLCSLFSAWGRNPWIPIGDLKGICSLALCSLFSAWGRNP